MKPEDFLNDALNSVFQTARASASEAHAETILPEHLLQAMLRKPNTRAVAVLKKTGADTQAMQKQVNAYLAKLPRRGFDPGSPDPVQSDRTNAVIGVAFDEMRRAKKRKMTTEHLLLALLQDYQEQPGDSAYSSSMREGEDMLILGRYGVDLPTTRQAIADYAAEHPLDPSSQEFSTTDFNPEEGPESRTPELDKHGADLTALARAGKLKPFVGRDEELLKLVKVLLHEDKNNAMVIGPPGVGKTALVEALALAIASGSLPEEVREALKDTRIVRLDLNSIVAGTSYRGEMEERAETILKELKDDPNTIVFIDEIHTISKAGDAEGGLTIGNIFKQALARGDMKAIGATTTDEYGKYFEKDGAMTRRFGLPIILNAPTVEETVEILKGRRPLLEAHHGVHIPDEVLERTAKLVDDSIRDRNNPDASIDVLDDAAATVRLNRISNVPGNILELENELTKATARREAERDIAKKEPLRGAELSAAAALYAAKSEWRASRAADPSEVTFDDAAAVVATWTGIPARRLTEALAERLSGLESELHKRVVGQHSPIKGLARAVRKGMLGFKMRKGAVAFFFLGPTGVGKTETVLSLAEQLFGSDDSVIKLDMSEYMEKHSVSRLFGSPPGYEGHEDGGQLTEQVRRRPYSVLLVDEAEKAHPDVMNAFLQILEDGKLTDAKGRAVDFSHVVVIFTSNLGVVNAEKKSKGIGFGAIIGEMTEAQERTSQGMLQREQQEREFKREVLNAFEEHFSPEFRNRVGKKNVFVFDHLTREDLIGIVDMSINRLYTLDGVKDRDLRFEFSDAAKAVIAREGYDRQLGARPINEKVDELVIDRVTDGLVLGFEQDGEFQKVEDGDTVYFDATSDGRDVVMQTHPFAHEPLDLELDDVEIAHVDGRALS